MKMMFVGLVNWRICYLKKYIVTRWYNIVTIYFGEPGFLITLHIFIFWHFFQLLIFLQIIYFYNILCSLFILKRNETDKNG